jgi:hypothetical protein
MHRRRMACKWAVRMVLLETYYDDPEATRQAETAWRMLITMAERVLDLPHETLR